MQTRLAEFVKARPEYQELDNILRACVHCGFCNAACPTYLLTGNELNGPRGRIYLLKQLFEGQPVSEISQSYLDRCLTCRACEATCPSGVRYGRLLDVGREIIEKKVKRKWPDLIKRRLITNIFPYRQRFSALLNLARLVKPVLPKQLRQKIPPQVATPAWPEQRHQRKMLIMSGCIQTPLAPHIDAVAASVLHNLGISLIRLKEASCCGALNYHLADRRKAEDFARNNIDACWPYIEQGAEAIVSTASGCGVMIKDYSRLLQNDREYAEKAAGISSMTKDISEVLQREDIGIFYRPHRRTVAFQSPCTLQHGQQLNGLVEALLSKLGYQLAEVKNNHLCCGSAGVYSLLQAGMSNQLRDEKLDSLLKPDVDVIATANIGCLLHLQSAAIKPVVHWLELISGQ